MTTGGLYALVDPYPLARQDRGRNIPTGGGPIATVTAPRISLIAFTVREAGPAGPPATRARVTSRRLRGPALIDWVLFDVSHGATNGAWPALLIGWSASDTGAAVNQDDVPVSGVNPLIEHIAESEGQLTLPALSDGITMGVNGASQVQYTLRLGALVNAPEFFLVFEARAPFGGTSSYNGAVRVLENMDPDDAAAAALS